MPLKNHYTTIFFPLLGIFFFSCINTTNFYILKTYLLVSKGLNGEQLEQIEQTRLLGFIIAGFALTQVINKLTNKILILTSLLLLIICTINLIIFNNYIIIKINFILMAIGAFVYCSSIIMHIIELSEKKYFCLALTIFLWTTGYLIVNLLDSFVTPSTNTIIVYALLYFLNILTEFLHYNNTRHNLEINSKFSLLIKNVELQLLTGFTITYVIFDILWYYEAFALKYQLSLISSKVILLCMLKAIAFSIIPISYIINKVNKYSFNLLMMIILLVNFILLPIYGQDKWFNLLFIVFIGICLSSIFLCNILMLIDKFQAYELRTGMFSYFSMCAIGIYSGALSSSTPYGFINAYDFLFSVFVVVGSFICYYLWNFFRYKLYKI